ncbi:ABC transporter [Candidatus Nomurabacteria bacterium RIFCSPHIGHO2_01_FULL_40_24b]|uniref:ABC transporter n=1 Tax=Candidatus Nomurabacteria bacterium RIFCSPHIGHO2_01_FULL_40_24b TaxID=1801739 RepID=A0A1F6V7Z1_9BACT|nr:MAG: ABC transporter [Candidatus Nomurabacteria bacterium RIFCSPHIGHO2_01_FULL_40_24b]
MTKNIISIKNLHKSYGTKELETPVLRGIDLEVGEGEFLGIMGKSGAGKSTLMYQIGLLDHPTSGEIILNNVNTEKLSMEERTQLRLFELGYVFQDYALIPELSASENVMIPILMQGKSFDEAKKIGQNILDKVGLSNRTHNKPSALSGGEQQRVSIARAMAHNPKILFADEPTANLDTASGHSIIELFKDLHQRGQTIVMVTHEEEYAKYCNRIIHLEDGKIVKESKQK